jgi:hypothetical protein
MNKSHFTRAIFVSLFVGIILNLVNNYEPIMKLQFSIENTMRVIFTFLVPFSVSLYSSWRTSKDK